MISIPPLSDEPTMKDLTGEQLDVVLAAKADAAWHLHQLTADIDLDAFVANQGVPNRVWLNDGSGRFSSNGQSLGGFRASIDVDVGDLDAERITAALRAHGGSTRLAAEALEVSEHGLKLRVRRLGVSLEGPG